MTSCLEEGIGTAAYFVRKTRIQSACTSISEISSDFHPTHLITRLITHHIIYHPVSAFAHYHLKLKDCHKENFWFVRYSLFGIRENWNLLT